MNNGDHENLREYYITPLYLQTMGARARDWSVDHIRHQLALFRRTIPDYPEVLELLESELHLRSLNTLHRGIRKADEAELAGLLEKYANEPDYCEIIEAELAIRKGARHLHDASGET